MRSAKQPQRFPKVLSEAQVEALLAAPDCGTPLGLRDRTMLELMYASGLRVSELVLLKSVEVGMNEGVLRIPVKATKRGWCRLAKRRAAGSSAICARRGSRFWPGR